MTRQIDYDFCFYLDDSVSLGYTVLGEEKIKMTARLVTISFYINPDEYAESEDTQYKVTQIARDIIEGNFTVATSTTVTIVCENLTRQIKY